MDDEGGVWLIERRELQGWRLNVLNTLISSGMRVAGAVNWMCAKPGRGEKRDRIFMAILDPSEGMGDMMVQDALRRYLRRF